MNYLTHYTTLINRAKSRNLPGYKEIHHIIPRCIGGSDDKSNLVSLTPEEHYTAHLLLVKIYPDVRELVHAAIMMTVNGNNHNRSKNKAYGWLRRKHADCISVGQSGSGNSQFGRYWIYSLSTGEVKRISSSEIPDGWIRGKTPNTLCKVCNRNTGSKQRNYCDNHRPIPKPPISSMKKGSAAAIKLSNHCLNRKKEEHPQYNKRWVNDGYKQIMVPADELENFLSNGWHRGKIRASS